jgi:hypothetical protein
MATVNEKMTAIADAIRDKTGGIDTLTLDDMAADIPKVYEQGKKSQYDEFWDAFQNNGKRINYQYAFAGAGWCAEILKPKYKITPTTNFGAQGMFSKFNVSNEDKKLDFRTVKDMFDLSQAKNCDNLFDNARVDYIDVDLSSATTMQSAFNGSFSNPKVTHITLRVKACTNYSATFTSCSALTDLFFTEDSTIKTTIGMKYSPLTLESARSVINALVDYSGTTATYTLTLHADAKARLSESDIATITQKGWTLA